MIPITPSATEEFQHAFTQNQTLLIQGTGSTHHLLPSQNHQTITTTNYAGITDFRPDDLIVTVKSGTLIQELQQELQSKKLALPLADPNLYGQVGTPNQTIGGLLANALPHALEHPYGPVKSWVTGMTLLLSTNEVVKVGAQVVKSVAGYDIHKLICGSRGSLALILEATLRLHPLAQIQPPDIFFQQGNYTHVHGIPLRDFESNANSFPNVAAANRLSGHVWTNNPLNLPPTNSNIVYTIGPHGHLQPTPPESIQQIQRKLKEQFDPRSLFPPTYEYMR